MCAQTPGLLQDLLAVLPPVLQAQSSDSLSSSESSFGHDWLQVMNLLPGSMLRPCTTLALSSVLSFCTFSSVILLQHLAKMPATRFVEPDLQWPLSVVLQRLAFFLCALLSSGWPRRKPIGHYSHTVKDLLREQSSFVSQLAFLEI